MSDTETVEPKTISIHGKSYMPVSERVKLAHADLKELSITTEVLTHSPVVVKATVTTPKGTFTGISAANPQKSIEKMSPYEVAETSSVGRALGFAGYGIIDSIASADEMQKADPNTDWLDKANSYEDTYSEEEMETQKRACPIHSVPMFKGTSKTKTNKDGSPKKYWWHSDEEGQMCFGNERA